MLMGFDTLFLMMGYEQIGQITHSVMMYAWSYPSDANIEQDINQVIAANIKNSIGTVTLGSAPSESFDCLQTDGSTMPAASDGSCTTGQPETLVSYQIILTIQLPVTFGLVKNPYLMTSYFTIRVI